MKYNLYVEHNLLPKHMHFRKYKTITHDGEFQVCYVLTWLCVVLEDFFLPREHQLIAAFGDRKQKNQGAKSFHTLGDLYFLQEKHFWKITSTSIISTY